MKRLFRTLCAVFIGSTVLTACLNDDDQQTATYSDVAITQFTLGTLNRYTHVTSSATGNDSVVKTTLTGSNYRMTIDHLQQLIFNNNDLPVGTDVAHVVCTITTKNGGLVALQSMTSDSLRWFSSTDSIDFTQPRTFRVFASDGLSSRDYTVRLNVSQNTGINFGWELTKTDTQMAGWTTGKRIVAQGDSVLLVDADSIIGQTTHESYMMDSDGHMKKSTDGGISWTDELLDDDETLLPAVGTAVCVTWPYAPADNTEYVLMVGRPRQGDVQTMRVWRKITSGNDNARWIYMPFDDINNYPLTLIDGISMACYDGTVLCVGNDLVMRQSRDQGVTWRTTSDYALPATLTGTRVIMTADTKEQLWLLTDTGQLWKGATTK